MARFDTADVRRYYDRHTTRFVQLGQGGGSIHRAVWGPGTTSREQAFHYVDDRIAELIRRLPHSHDGIHVVDLGCGVGASLCALAAQLPIRGTGVTLSPSQVQIARQRIAAAGLSDRVECHEGDYSDLPSTVPRADLAYAIESFVHAPSAERFFEQCSRLVKPGGALVICDDVKRNATSLEAARAVDTFARGWHINTLLERDDIITRARAAGFDHESITDLTPYLEIRRVRDRFIAAGLVLLRWLRIDRRRFDDVVGGTALQTCLARGWIGYELIVFRRRAEFGLAPASPE